MCEACDGVARTKTMWEYMNSVQPLESGVGTHQKANIVALRVTWPSRLVIFSGICY